jgi:hypothetical protein
MNVITAAGGTKGKPADVSIAAVRRDWKHSTGHDLGDRDIADGVGNR